MPPLLDESLLKAFTEILRQYPPTTHKFFGLLLRTCTHTAKCGVQQPFSQGSIAKAAIEVDLAGNK